MTSVGLLCNCSADEDPKEQLSPSIVNRAMMIDEILAPDGIHLFLFSPKDVSTASEVSGFRVEGHDLVAAKQPVPRVNANWTYGTRKLLKQDMGYNGFKRWTRENQIRVYVPYEFSELVSNKRKAYDAVREDFPGLHPHTEDYTGSPIQIGSFLDRSEVAFIKPRAGNKGNRIFVLRKAGAEYSMKYYDDGEQRLFSPIPLDSAMRMVDIGAGSKSYVIQEGIESLRYDGAVFDVRVVMVNDGSAWHSILETRLAPPDSDLSNIFQGGSIQVTEDLFESMFGEDDGRALTEEVRRVAHGVAERLELLYPGDLMELGFDFVLDTARSPHLVEINAKPGIAGFGSETKIFDWKEEDEHYYRKWVYPHVTHLASFLRKKAQEL